MSTLAAPPLQLPTFNVQELVARLVKTGMSADKAQAEAEAVRDLVVQCVEATLTAKTEMSVSGLTVIPSDPKQAATRGDMHNLSGDINLVHKDIRAIGDCPEFRVQGRLNNQVRV